MTDERLVDFPSKTTPDTSDIIYVGDMSDGGNEVQSTLGQIIDSNNIVTTLGSITAGNIPVLGGTQNVKDSGIPVDISRNITNVTSITLTQDPTTSLQVATKQYADTKLAKSSNLSDLVSPSSARTNLGLGTSAVKAVTDNSQSNVASAKGSFTTGHILTAADSSGTVQDGGATSQFLIASNNLSDVANKTTSFNNVSPMTTAGDLIVFNGTNNVRLPGSTTDGYVPTYDSTQPSKIKWAPIPSPGDQIRVITTTTVLTSADYGKTIVCGGSSSYTVTLPAASAGLNNFIYFVINTSSNALVTIASTDNISGQSSVKLGVYDGLTLMTNGSTYLIMDSSLYPVTLQAYASTQQTITSSGSIVFQVDTPIYDNGSSLNAGTYTVTPKWPGKYEMFYQFLLVAPATTALVQTKINFNASIAASAYQSLDGTASFGGFGAVPLTYTSQCNGSTDNFTFTASQQSTGAASQLVNNNPVFSYIQMKRISMF